MSLALRIHRFNRLAVFLAATLLAACANLDPKLVTGTEAVPPDGLRFYMTRPFVVVHRPFPIEAKAFLVSGTVSADGKFVQLTDVPDEFRRAVPAGLGTERVSTGALLRAPAGVQAQSDVAETPATSAGDATNAGSTAPKDDGKVGYSNYTVTTDLAGLAVMPMNDLFSIAFLPDYDREFVVETKGKLGVTRLNLSLGPGSTMLGMSGESDNTAWASIVLDSIRSLATAGTDRLVGLIGGAAKAAKGATAQSDVAGEYRKLAGEPVTLRAYVVKMATIGLYPIVKPCEVAPTGRPDCKPWVAASSRTILPVERPYQVPYEYYDVVLFEHVLTESTPYLLTIGATPGAGPQQANCGGKVPAAGLEASRLAFLDLVRDQGISDIRFSSPSPTSGCADTLRVRATAAGLESAAARKVVADAFAKRYPNTQPQIDIGE